VGADIKNEDFCHNKQLMAESPPFNNYYKNLNDYLEIRAPELKMNASDVLNSKEV
jgi:hypothetical protein